ncbi:hypothetical protein DNTS_029356 [Danionella cerebrum]|uniref:F-actin-capping protein subunit beta n=1 Tax=Danionella cerebrum TaxID=2873325 RepID=A0A553Q7W8_9TELE|nr:hypothetical protein DNTS_029356 [Danionella translucida]
MYVLALAFDPCECEPGMRSQGSSARMEGAAGFGPNNEQQLDCALDLMRRLPPQQIEKNLSDLIDLPWRPSRRRSNSVSVMVDERLIAVRKVTSCPCVHQVPSLCEDLLSSVDQPLKIARDKVVGKDYLLCDYNRDGDSYRSENLPAPRQNRARRLQAMRLVLVILSPWSNKYEPPIDDGAMPSARLRKLEVEANNAFDQYRDLYFEGGVSSVYLWDLDHGFAGVILIKKAGDGSKKIKGCWDSIHVVEVQVDRNRWREREEVALQKVSIRGEPGLSVFQEKSSGRTAHYKLTSTVMLWLQTTKTGSGTMNLGGSLTRQMEKDETVSESSPHIANIGRLVEEMENKIRSTLNQIYFGKTKDIVNGLRYGFASRELSVCTQLSDVILFIVSQRLARLSLSLIRSIESLPDNLKYRQLQRELSQVLTQRQIYIE